MINYFEFLKGLLFSKRHASEDEIEQNMSSSFMMNNWISGYNPEIIEFLNETINKHAVVFSKNKGRLYDFYFNIIPKLKYSNLNYPKAEKRKEESKNHSKIKVLADNMEMSIREIEYLVDNGYINIENVKVE